MAVEMSYVLITPYSLMKSRTGGIIARLLSRTDLDFIGAQMLTFTAEQAERYAQLLIATLPVTHASLLANYVRENFVSADPNAKERILMLLFKGEDACRKLSEITGRLSHKAPRGLYCGETIRDTYADMVEDRDNPQEIRYFEPAVFTPPNSDSARDKLQCLADVAASQPNIVEHALGSEAGDERTLVIIKPENWRHPSSRPGNIIDMLSRTGLKIVGCKVYRMSVANAMEFYGPVQQALRSKLAPSIAEKAKTLLESEWGIALPESTLTTFTETVGHAYADDQFGKLVEFMSGRNPFQCDNEERDEAGLAKCMILIYEGKDAIQKIRSVLGPTDPGKAPGGTVRRDFGSDVMVNTAHASDAPESVVREMRIVQIEDNPLSQKIQDFLDDKA